MIFFPHEDSPDTYAAHLPRIKSLYEKAPLYDPKRIGECWPEVAESLHRGRVESLIPMSAMLRDIIQREGAQDFTNRQISVGVMPICALGGEQLVVLKPTSKRSVCAEVGAQLLAQHLFDKEGARVPPTAGWHVLGEGGDEGPQQYIMVQLFAKTEHDVVAIVRQQRSLCDYVAPDELARLAVWEEIGRWDSHKGNFLITGKKVIFIDNESFANHVMGPLGGIMASVNFVEALAGMEKAFTIAAVSQEEILSQLSLACGMAERRVEDSDTSWAQIKSQIRRIYARRMAAEERPFISINVGVNKGRIFIAFKARQHPGIKELRAVVAALSLSFEKLKQPSLWKSCFDPREWPDYLKPAEEWSLPVHSDFLTSHSTRVEELEKWVLAS